MTGEHDLSEAVDMAVADERERLTELEEHLRLARERIEALTAQSSAMARLLLSLEWSDEARGDFWCPSCAQKQASGHAKDCAIVSVLRAAGVIP